VTNSDLRFQTLVSRTFLSMLSGDAAGASTGVWLSRVLGSALVDPVSLLPDGSSASRSEVLA
jgi:hypothetical protein